MRLFIIPAIMFSILVLFLSCDKDEGPDAFFINEIKFKKVQFMDLSKEGDGNIVRWNGTWEMVAQALINIRSILTPKWIHHIVSG